MLRIIVCLFAAALLYSCQPGNEKQATASQPVYDSSYQPAVFTDADRLARISQLFPAVDSMYRGFAEKNHFPAIAFGIVADGKLVYKNAYGHTDIDKKTVASTASLFRIASMTKSFTAMAILSLRDAGKLHLDDPVSKYIPEMGGQKYPTLDAAPITIRHLLTHGGGFPEDNPWGDRQLADSDKELMDFLKNSITFSNPPGQEYEYSNLGFALLGKIITTASGIPYQEYIRKHIWQPLGMHHSEWEYTKIAPDKLAHGYRWLNEKWNEEALLPDTPDGSWGAMGSMITSIDEFANYMALHLNAWPPSNAEESGPLKRSSVREMHYPWRINGFNPSFRYPDGRTCGTISAYGYGLGWMQDCEGREYIAHSGGLPGFGSQWRILPDYGIGVVAFANRTYAPIGSINIHVLDTLIKGAGLQPRQLPASAILQKRQQELMALLPDWKNAESSGLFAENFFPDNPIDSLRKQAQTLFAKAGKIISVKEMKAQNQLRGTFRVEGEKATLEIYFTLSPENPPLIQQYAIREVVKGK